MSRVVRIDVGIPFGAMTAHHSGSTGIPISAGGGVRPTHPLPRPRQRNVPFNPMRPPCSSAAVSVCEI
jgi:hypothetical protein